MRVRRGTDYEGCAWRGVWRGYGEAKERVRWVMAKKEGGTRRGLRPIPERGHSKKMKQCYFILQDEDISFVTLPDAALKKIVRYLSPADNQSLRKLSTR